MRVREEPPRPVLLGEEAPPGVAPGAGLHLEARLEELRGLRDPALLVHLPRAAAPLGETDDEARLSLRVLPPRPRLPRPVHVARALTVARLARHVQLGEGREETVLVEPVALAQVRGMALGALAVPALRELRPVQHVAVVHALARVEVEPALPALLLRAAVPRHGERLETPPRQLDQVLLQRDDAEGVGHRVVRQPSVGSVGADEGLSVLPVEAGRHARVGEAARRRSRRGWPSRAAPASRGRGASHASGGSPPRGTPRRRARRRTRAAAARSRSPAPGAAARGSPRPRPPPGPGPPAAARGDEPRASWREGSHGPEAAQRLRIRISVPPFSNDTSSISWLMR